MIHPSYVELMKVVNDDAVAIGEEPVVNSRYSIVSATAKRARQITDGAEPLVRIQTGQKALSIAVEEMYEGELKILTPEEIEEKEEEKRLFEEAEAIRRAEEEAARLAAEEERKAAEAEAAAEADEAVESDKSADDAEAEAEDTDEPAEE